VPDAGHGPSQPAGRALRVLVADDEDGTLSLLVTALTFAGFTVIPARDGVEALTLARKELPDIALLDVMMPGMDGREVCRRMDSDPALTHVPVILHSSADEKDIDWRRCGADAFLAKPFSVREVPGFLTSHLSSRASSDRPRARRLTDDEVQELAVRIRQAVRQVPDPASGDDVLSAHRELSPEDETRVEAALLALLRRPDEQGSRGISGSKRAPARRKRGNRPPDDSGHE
jgi:DNA-binding response OmpR family regulator